MSELAANGVQIYQFPVDDEAVAEMNLSMNAHFPFAVCGSTDFIRVGNKMVRARQYPWGTVQGSCFFNSYFPLIYIRIYFFSGEREPLRFREAARNVDPYQHGRS